MEKIKNFEKNFADYQEKSGGMNYTGYMAVSALFVGVIEVMMLIPIEWNEWEIIFLVSFLSSFGADFYMHPCMAQQENGKRVSIFEKLAFAPVGYKMIQRSLFRRLCRYILVTTGMAVLLQTGMTLAVGSEKLGLNLWCTVLSVGLVPFFGELAGIYWRK